MVFYIKFWGMEIASEVCPISESNDVIIVPSSVSYYKKNEIFPPLFSLPSDKSIRIISKSLGYLMLVSVKGCCCTTRRI